MARGPVCPIHGHWVCNSCGWTRRNANRLNETGQDCYECPHPLGQWIDVRHNNPLRAQECIELAESLATKKPLCKDEPNARDQPKENLMAPASHERRSLENTLRSMTKETLVVAAVGMPYRRESTKTEIAHWLANYQPEAAQALVDQHKEA